MRASLMGPVMSSRPVRQILVSARVDGHSARSLLQERDLVRWAGVENCSPNVSPAGYLLLSVVSAKAAIMMRSEKGKWRALSRGAQFVGSRLTSPHAASPPPPSRRRDLGEQGLLRFCPLSDSSSSVIEAYRVCLEGHGGLVRGRAERSHPRSRAAVCAPGAKGLTARTSAAERSACHDRLRSCVGRLGLGPPERGTVDPHAMQDHRQLARHSNFSALHTAPLGHLQSPAFER